MKKQYLYYLFKLYIVLFFACNIGVNICFFTLMP